MRERDGHLPGVPYWVDTSQSDPEAAVALYGALFGWDFEDVTPPGSAGKYFIARLLGATWPPSPPARARPLDSQGLRTAGPAKPDLARRGALRTELTSPQGATSQRSPSSVSVTGWSSRDPSCDPGR
jgi:hypothetical protein